MNKYTCPMCGSDDVQVLEQKWVNPNTGEIDNENECPPAQFDCYCNNCCDSVVMLDCEHECEDHRVTCGNCNQSWCERCDPAPSAQCHYCNGRGHSLQPLPVQPERGYWDDDPKHPASDWQAEVEAGDTRASYAEWLETQQRYDAEDDEAGANDFKCAACGRDESVCSRNPCATVQAERAEA